MRTHDGRLLPGLLRRKYRLVRLPFPGDAIATGGVADSGAVFALSRVPEMIAIAAFQDQRTVDVVFPVGLLARAQNDLWFGPADAVVAFNQRNAGLGTPRNPHAICIALFEHTDVETRAVSATQHGVAIILDPTSGCFSIG